MDLRDLHYFQTIAELRHMGRAAERLHRTQPALTSCVRRLEAACGTPLFERAGRGIALTEAGQVLLRWAGRLQLDVHDARQEIADIRDGLSGHVRLGIVPTVAQSFLPPVVRQLLAEAPDVTLSITVGVVDGLTPMVRAGQLDLMVATGNVAEAGLVSRTIANDQIVVVASATHELCRRKASMRDLAACRWVLQPVGSPTRDWLDRAFERQRLARPRVQIESTMLLMLPSLIAGTDLLGFVSRHHLERRYVDETLKEIPLKAATMPRRLMLTHRRASYLSPAAQRLIELLSSVGAV